MIAEKEKSIGAFNVVMKAALALRNVCKQQRDDTEAAIGDVRQEMTAHENDDTADIWVFESHAWFNLQETKCSHTVRNLVPISRTEELYVHNCKVFVERVSEGRYDFLVRPNVLTFWNGKFKSTKALWSQRTSLLGMDVRSTPKPSAV